jgi:hypothetical protein
LRTTAASKGFSLHVQSRHASSRASNQPYAHSDRGRIMYPQNQKVVDVKAAKVKHMLSDEIDIQRLRFSGHTLRRDSAVTQGLPSAGRTGFRAPERTLRGELRSLAAEVGLTDPLFVMLQPLRNPQFKTHEAEQCEGQACVWCVEKT